MQILPTGMPRWVILYHKLPEPVLTHCCTQPASGLIVFGSVLSGVLYRVTRSATSITELWITKSSGMHAING